jgi:hypothetical protein
MCADSPKEELDGQARIDARPFRVCSVRPTWVCAIRCDMQRNNKGMRVLLVLHWPVVPVFV